jgi:hypothetical protein
MPITPCQFVMMTIMAKALLKPLFSWFGFGLSGLVIGYLVLAYILPPGTDTLWRLHIATGLLEGKSLYHDFIEVNPPLWFWSALPAAFLGGYPAIVGINLVASLVALWLFHRLLSVSLPQNSVRSAVFGLALGLFLVPVAEIGQREQAFLVASALWCALASARIERKHVAAPLIIAATCFAAYGFALKHYFVLVPLAIEAILIWKLRRDWRPFRLETSLLALCACLYGCAVVFFSPNFLGPILDLVQTTYFGFSANEQGLFESLYQKMGLIIVLLAFGWALTRDKPPITSLLVVSILCAFAAVLLQEKGWRYHWIAAHGLLLVVAALALEQALANRRGWFAALYVSAGLLGTLFFAFVSPSLSLIQTGGEMRDKALVRLVEAEPAGHHIAILSSAPHRAFYVVARAGRPHWSRFLSLWMLPGAIVPQSDRAKEAKRVVTRDRIISDLSADLTCRPPDLIIGERGVLHVPQRVLFDSVEILRHNKDFAAWLDRNYAQQAAVNGFPVWRLKGAKPPPSKCLKPLKQ